MKALLEQILKRIVKNPEQLAIAEFENEEEIVYEIVVNPDDVGQIIGKDGRTIKSINTILNAARGENNKKFVLKVIR
ncbi:MAG: KH domain-containing protein [Thermotogae bacterium]|nr:KH domain-containing protein [Thermotogota bacterium]MCP5465818.1 KH domain-containing protein [Thermotogota bacterium]HOO74949.1 KH domain-containing protein [Tepiditoga sp.]